MSRVTARCPGLVVRERGEGGRVGLGGVNPGPRGPVALRCRGRSRPHGRLRDPEAPVVAAQSLPGPQDPGLDRGDGRALHCGHLLHREPFELVQHPRLPPLRGTPRQRAGGPPGRVELLLAHPTVLAGEAPHVLGRLIERQEPLPEAATRTGPVNGEENGEEPGPESLLIAQGVELVEGAQDGLLVQVVPVAGGSAQVARRPERLSVDRLQQANQILPAPFRVQFFHAPSGGVGPFRPSGRRRSEGSEGMQEILAESGVGEAPEGPCR